MVIKADMSRNKCVVCGRFITWRFSVCRKCEKIYGKRVKDWPEWLHFLVKDHKAEKERARYRKKVGIVEVPLSSNLGYVMIEHLDPFDTDIKGCASDVLHLV